MGCSVSLPIEVALKKSLNDLIICFSRSLYSSNILTLRLNILLFAIHNTFKFFFHIAITRTERLIQLVKKSFRLYRVADVLFAVESSPYYIQLREYFRNDFRATVHDFVITKIVHL